MTPPRTAALHRLSTTLLAVCMIVSAMPTNVAARQERMVGSRNITIAGRLPTEALSSGAQAARPSTIGDLVVEQSISRPFAYVAFRNEPSGFAVVDISDPASPVRISTWLLPSSFAGVGVMDLTLFELSARTYLFAAIQRSEDDAGSDLGAVILDVTEGEPVERARVRVPRGLHHAFAYRHSDGRALIMATGGESLYLFDGEALVRGASDPVAEMAIPEDVDNVSGGFFSATAAYDPETETDRLYAAGAGGYYVYDITDFTSPELLVTINSAAVQTGHAAVPTPNGSHLVTTTAYTTAPVRIFDLRPGLSGEISRLRTAVGAWTANWKGHSENVAVRWPFFFAAAREDGFHAVNMMNPLEPYTDGFLSTGGTTHEIDVRNADGLVAVTDTETGLWLLRVEGFEGWNGRGWGLPDISSAQDWENGPQDSIAWPMIEDSTPASAYGPAPEIRPEATASRGAERTAGGIRPPANATASAGNPRLEQPTHPPPPGERGSANVTVLSHIPLGAPGSVSDVEIEQDMSRPYAYVTRRETSIGFDVIDLSDPDHARVIQRWRIENEDLHAGSATDGRLFEHDGRMYYVQGFQMGQGGPDSEVGAIVFDVTDLPERLTEVGRVRQSEDRGGFHNLFMYRHSSGKPLLFATSGQYAKVFDMGMFVDGDRTEMDPILRDENRELIARVPVPESEGLWSRGYHDFYVAHHPESGQDRFYGGGGSGYYVFNVTDLSNPELLATILGVPGVSWGHTFTPTPDGNFAIGETEFQYQPLRIFDLRPALRGEVSNIDHAVGFWHADWEALAHNHEVRWPYVFVSGYQSGMSVFDMSDPTDPYTVAYFDTFNGIHNDRGQAMEQMGSPYTWNVYDGAWGVDVRNADGLIVVSDLTTGFWAFKMDGFDGWNGEDWGVPNISSAQPWSASSNE